MRNLFLVLLVVALLDTGWLVPSGLCVEPALDGETGPANPTHRSKKYVSFTRTMQEGIDDGDRLQVDVIPNQILAQFKEGPTASAAAVIPQDWRIERLGGSKALGQLQSSSQSTRQTDPRLALIQLPEGTDLAAAVRALQGHTDIEFAEPNYRVQLAEVEAPSAIPNDFYFPDLWGLDNTGQTGGVADADIDLPEAWELGTGSRSIVVGVIDTGIDYFHQDLVSNVWTNDGEIAGNGVDDDLNGYRDDYHGFDFVSNDGDPMDDRMHGTHVAGTIGATPNNRWGVAGVSQQVSLMAVKAFDETGNSDVATIVKAVRYVIENGGHIVNASWGIDVRSESMRQVVNEAYEAGVLFVAAAGNRRTDRLFFPAAFEHTFAVGATNDEDQVAFFSSFGDFVDVSAPGQAIFSTRPNNRYGFLSGTSMATPHVVGIAALRWAAHPELTVDELSNILRNSVDEIQVTKAFGSGRINAWKALAVQGVLPTAVLDVPAEIGGRLSIKGTADGERFSNYRLAYGKGRSPTEWTEFWQSSSAVRDANLMAAFNTEVLEETSYTLRLDVEDSLGQIATDKAFVRVKNVKINSPLHNDVLRVGEVIEIRGNSFGQGRQHVLEVGIGTDPQEWLDTGIELVTAGQSEIFNGALANWDTSQVEPDRFYTLRLTTTNDQGLREEQRVVALYLDGTLRPGWPQYNEIDVEIPDEDWHQASVADLDGDGFKEIVVVEAGNLFGHPSRLLVYDHEGGLRWSHELGDGEPLHDIPLIGDLDGDGLKEVFVEGGTKGLLVALDHQGTPLAGEWPLNLNVSERNLAKVMADLDRDGVCEIIALSQPGELIGSGLRTLMVIDRSAKIRQRWTIPNCFTDVNVPEQFPAVGNMDDDPELEIVAVSDCNGLSVFDLDDPSGSVWSAYTFGGRLVASPVVGDLNNDGFDEIVIGVYASSDKINGGVYVFDRDGMILPGWPVLVESSFEATAALADFDDDGDLEISIPSVESQMLHLIHHHGFEQDHWPIGPIRDGRLKSSPLIGDIDGDGGADVIMAVQGFSLSVVRGDKFENAGGIRAWNLEGSPIDLNPFPGLDQLVMESSGGLWFKYAPPVLTDLDNDGLLDIVSTTVHDLGFSLGSPRVVFKNRNSIYAWELDVPFSSEAFPWPEFQRDSNRSGYFESAPQPSQPPEVGVLLDQTIPTGGMFFQIELDRYVRDPDTARRDLTWRVEGHRELIVDLTVNRVVSVHPPGPDWEGSETLRFVVSDPQGLSDERTATFTVLRDYVPPTATEDVLTLTEDERAEIDLLANDIAPAGERLEIIRIIPSLFASIHQVNESTVEYRPNLNFNGVDHFNYVIGDGSSGIAIGNVSVNVRAVNDPPAPVLDRVVTTEEQPIAVDPLANDEDPDHDELVLFEFLQPENGTLDLMEDGALLYTPKKDFSGLDAAVYRVRDPSGLETTSEMKFLVQGVNDLPLASDQTVTINRNRKSTVIFRAVDADGDDVSFEVVDAPEHGEILVFNNSVGTYQPNHGYSGADRFTYRANDGRSDGPLATVTITVRDVNNAPDVDPQSIVTAVNQSVDIALQAEDVDEDQFAFEITSDPLHGLLTREGDTLRYSPDQNFIGMDSIGYQAVDIHGANSRSEISIEVTDINTAPEAEDVTVDAFGNQPVEFELSATDPESNPLIYSLKTRPEYGAVTGDVPHLIYTPKADFFGFDKLTYTASDNEFESNTGSVIFDIQFPNHPPVSTNQDLILQMNRDWEFELKVEDEENDALRAVILKGPQKGHLVGLGSTLVFVPNSGTTGSDSFTYRVWDGHGYSNVAKVNVQITRFDPNFHLEFESIGQIAQTGVRLILRTEPSRNYALQASTDLIEWEDIAEQSAEGDQVVFTDPIDADSPRKFYRARLIR